MKRELFENAKVIPYTSGDAIERSGFLSLVLGCKVGTTGDLIVTITDSKDGEAYETVKDEMVFVSKASKDGAITESGVEKDDVVNFDIDLVGLKQYIKITVSGTASANTTLAVTLGDSAVQPEYSRKLDRIIVNLHNK